MHIVFGYFLLLQHSENLSSLEVEGDVLLKLVDIYFLTNEFKQFLKFLKHLKLIKGYQFKVLRMFSLIYDRSVIE